MASQTIEQFYQDFETLPKLISMLALSVADAQTRLDQGYLAALKQLAQVAGELKGSNVDIGQFIDLFKAMGPSRYQFTETVVDVRADLRMSTGSEFSIGGSLGLKTPMFAVAVNASYLQRTAADFQASALIHCVIHAVTSDTNVMKTLLDAAPKLNPGSLTHADVGKGILDGWMGLFGFRLLPDTLPAATLNQAYPAISLQGVGGNGATHFTPGTTGWLTIGDDGKLSGTPNVSGPLDFTVTAKDSSPTPVSVTKQYTIQVNNA
ncbi:MAG TPA: hypothetical protein VG649_15370 [Candidatus Angelobacter sp.]|nr:hypothetical protein [Candidatus Angelobacter sp.]